MKKFVLGFVSVVLCLALVGCAGASKAPEATKRLGRMAVKAVDSYLDGDLSKDELRAKLNGIETELMALDFSDTMDQSRNRIVRSWVGLLGTFTINQDDKTAEIFETRNKIAKEIGEKNR